MWFILKILFFIVIAVFVRGVLPRYRIDQILAENWKLLIFLYIYFFLEALVLLYFNLIC